MAGTLVDYTTPFPGGPTFYTGTSSPSELVPDIFPVAIAGRPYMLDMASGRYARAFEARLRESVDQSNIPGENSINPQGLWRRSQTSWNFGMEQKYGDILESQANRFFDSLGVDVWEEGELTLLKDTYTVSAHTGSNTDNIFMVVAGGELFWSVNQTIKYSANPLAGSPTITDVASTPAAKIRSMASDGTTVFATFAGTGAAGGLVKVPAATHTQAVQAHGVEFGFVDYAKGFLFVGGAAGTADRAKLWWNPAGNNPTVNFTHPNASWTWVGAAAGQNAIYVAGFAGQTSLIYKVTIKSDGTLDVPVVAAELPVGEVVKSIESYLGFVLIGTDKGLRVATSDSESNLVLGQTYETAEPVLCANGFGQYVWIGLTDYTATKTGLGRVDLSRLVGPNEPARATDLMHTGQGDVLSVVNFEGRQLFSVSGVGVIAEEATELVESGYIDVGTWRWGIPDQKVLAFFDVETEKLKGSVSVEFAYDGNGFGALGTMLTPDSTTRSFVGPDTLFREARFRLTLSRSSTNSAVGPVVLSWQARAVPYPTRSEVLQVPILLHHRINRFNREYDVDVAFELEFLRGLVNDPRVVNYQEGVNTLKVVIENVEWVPLDTFDQDYRFDGTCTVTMRSLVA